jgi:predicted unusual protein kinase regulating ubiquinone biosynthesis (AarF/ABC1/UbiB family)
MFLAVDKQVSSPLYLLSKAFYHWYLKSSVFFCHQVQVGELLAEVFRVCYRHRVKIESNFSSIILAIFVLEGIGRSLDPELDIMERAKPILLGNALT